MRSSLVLLFAAFFIAACGDSNTSSSGGSGGSTASGGSTSTGGSTSSGGGGSSGGSTSSGGGGSTTSTTSSTFTFPIVINEINATGEDWVELVNSGASPVDLGDYGLADSDAAGGPKTASAARFPQGTTVPAGGFVFVVAEQDPAAGVGPHDVCLTVGGPSSCFYATWGISAANGEKLYLLAPDDSIVAEAEYPMNAVVSPNTWGRLPDGTGDFTATAATPGEANKAP